VSEIIKEDWLKLGLRLLDSTGRNSLKISNLCSSLKLTKGAFYHWFESKADYDLSLLSYWRELFTIQFIENANVGETSKDKLQILINHCINSMREDSQLEIEINMWAKQDEEINEFVIEVYEKRFKYIENLLLDIYGNKEEAKRHSLILYSLVIGVDLFYRKLSKKELKLIFKDYL
jgi:AcrR family transcriptional regulator